MAGPERIGRYELVAHLATGGMGQVYLARAGGIGGFVRHVVLKTLDLPGTDEDEASAMFLDEARLLGLLHHQHIAPIFEIDKDASGRLYLVMDYVHGHTAHDVWQRTIELGAALPVDFSLTLAAAAASGLHYAHTRRNTDGRSLHIVHRDVTLSNLMVGFDGAIKLIDFGIAKAANRSTQTQVGFIKGKVGYMAPEQLRGLSVDARTDVFALGIVLYELTTMRRAFREESDRATMERIKAGALVMPSTIIPDYPPQLERIVTRALRVDPRERYPDAEAMRRELDLLGHQLGLVLGDAAIVEVMTQLFEHRNEPWQRARPVRAETELEVSLELVPSAVHEDERTRPTAAQRLPLRAATESTEAMLDTPPRGLPKKAAGFTIAFDGGPATPVVPATDPAMPATPAPPPAAAPSKDTDGVPVLVKLPVPDAKPAKPAKDGKRKRKPAPSPEPAVAVAVVPPPPKRKTSAAGWILLVLLVGGAVAGGVYILQQDGGSPAQAKAPGAPPDPGATVTIQSAVPLSPSVMDDQGGGSAPRPPVVSPPGSAVQLHIKTTPADATVLLDSKRLGRTPYTGSIDAAAGTHTLKIRKKGYVTVSLEVELSGEIRQDITLQRAKSEL